MSAFIVDRAHIDALVTAALRPRLSLHWMDCDPDTLWQTRTTTDAYFQAMQAHTHHARYEDADRIGVMLWAANLASVTARYPDDASGARPGSGDTDEAIAAYTYRGRTPALEPVAVLKALSCYEYQSCEHAGWHGSEAERFCDALRSAMIACLPGYEDAAWEILPPPIPLRMR